MSELKHLPAVLTSMNASVWAASKLDRRTSEEIDASKQTTTRAGNYNKHLMAGVKELEAIKSFLAATRVAFYRFTQPWDDDGKRLLNATRLMDFAHWRNGVDIEFDRLVNVFVQKYPFLISAQALKLGQLFDRNEYPDPSVIREKFRLEFVVSPLPQAGDFRLDAFADVQQKVATEYAEHYQQRLEAAMKDAWDRVHKVLTHLAEQMAPHADGKRKRLHESMLTNGLELCEMLTAFNMTGDPKLEAVRRDLEQVLAGANIDILRESEDARGELKTQVDNIRSKFAL